MVHGRMKQLQGRITSAITRDPVRRTRMTARLGSGRAAHTEYCVLEQLLHFSFLEVRIKTGRTHQIRVHISSLGHPIVGDRLYGAPANIPNVAPLKRLFLHAHRLGFHQPSTGEPISIESPLPAELSTFLSVIRSADQISRR
jgi:23S rRNA pseudouridine1911/1915/1917 synthase